jgi:hypothetical protein
VEVLSGGQVAVAALHARSLAGKFQLALWGFFALPLTFGRPGAAPQGRSAQPLAHIRQGGGAARRHRSTFGSGMKEPLRGPWGGRPIRHAVERVRAPTGTGNGPVDPGRASLTGEDGRVSSMPAEEPENPGVIRSQSRRSLPSVDEGTEDAPREERRGQFATPKIRPGDIFCHP